MSLHIIYSVLAAHLEGHGLGLKVILDALLFFCQLG